MNYNLLFGLVFVVVMLVPLVFGEWVRPLPEYVDPAGDNMSGTFNFENNSRLCWSESDACIQDNGVQGLAIRNFADSSYRNLRVDDLTVNGDTVVVGETLVTGNLNMSDYDILDVDTIFVHNITGRSPVYISSEVIIDSNVTAEYFNGLFQGAGIFTNVTIENVEVTGDQATFSTDLIPNITHTYNLGSESFMWSNLHVNSINATSIVVSNLTADFIQVVNLVAGSIEATNMTTEMLSAAVIFTQEMYVNGTFNGSVNWSLIENEPENVSYWNNDANYVNSSQLNGTFNQLGVFEENVTISVSSGSGSGVTVNCCDFNAEILSLKVYPLSSNNVYRFSSNTSVSGESVDTDRIEHTGDWLIAHRGSTVLSENINLFITSASIDEDFIVNVRYRR